MKKRLVFITAVVALLVAACAPTMVHPQERVSDLPFAKAYQDAMRTINTEPYPSDSGGWVITQSDQTGGFISAVLTIRQCGFLGIGGCHTYTAHVSVTLVKRSNSSTLVSVGRSNDGQAKRLATDLLINLHASTMSG